MMYHLQTELYYFKFNSILQEGPMQVSWYKLVETESSEEGVCFNDEELDALRNYMVNNPVNFGTGNKNRLKCEDGDGPHCGLMDLIPLNHYHPRNLILRKDPHRSIGGSIYSCMDIELFNSNETRNHHYNLEFDIIGRIILI